MGTTLTALVERREPDRFWYRVAVWSLGKDHSLMAALATQTTKDWPLDARDRDRAEFDFHRYWLDGNTVIDSVDEPTPIYRALCASLLPLVQSGDVRILFVER